MNNFFNMGMMDEWNKQWEKMFSEWVEKTVNNPEFLSSVNKSLESAFDSKAVAEQLRAQILKSMALPSVELLGRIGGHVMRIESKILDLEDRMTKQSEYLEKVLIMLQSSAAEKGTAPAEKKSKTVKKTKKEAVSK